MVEGERLGGRGDGRGREVEWEGRWEREERLSGRGGEERAVRREGKEGERE